MIREVTQAEFTLMVLVAPTIFCGGQSLWLPCANGTLYYSEDGTLVWLRNDDEWISIEVTE